MREVQYLLFFLIEQKQQKSRELSPLHQKIKRKEGKKKKREA